MMVPQHTVPPKIPATVLLLKVLSLDSSVDHCARNLVHDTSFIVR